MCKVRPPLLHRRKVNETGESTYKVVPGMRTDQARRHSYMQCLLSYVEELPVRGR